MTSGQQGLLVISIVMLLINIALSSFFTYRSYKKNPQRGTREHIIICCLVFLFSFIIIGAIMFPAWVLFGIATYDRRAEYELQQQMIKLLPYYYEYGRS